MHRLCSLQSSSAGSEELRADRGIAKIIGVPGASHPNVNPARGSSTNDGA